MVSLHRSLADGSENVSGYFCGNVRRTVPQKPEELKRAAGQTASVSSSRARDQGECGFLWRSYEAAVSYRGAGVKRPARVEGKAPPS